MIQRSTALSLLALTCLSAPAAAQGFQPTWEQRFDGAVSQNDYAQDVAVAPGGEVYVAGFTFVQQSSSLFIPKFLTLKYDAAGQLLWSRTYGFGFSGGMGAAYHVAVDGQGDVLVAGQAQNGDYWALVKYDPAGNELWTTEWPTNSGFVSSPDDMALTPAGDVLLVGNVGDSFQGDLASVVKISAAGNLLWVRQFNGLNGIGSVRAVALTGAGQIALAGSTAVNGAGIELSVALLDAAGNPQWLRNTGYSGPSTHDFALDVLVDSAGRIVAAGVHGSNTLFGSDGAVVAYDTAGNLLWTHTYDGPAGRSDTLARIEEAPGGGFRAVGTSSAGPSNNDALTLALDSGGGLAWDRLFSGEQQQSDAAIDLAVDAAGKSFVAGWAVPQAGGQHALLAVYDAAGVSVGTSFYGGPTFADTSASAVALGPGGAVYVVGESQGIGTQNDAVTLAYDDEAPRAYCTGKVTSPGCLPQIGWSGTPTASATGGFTVSASLVVNQQLGTFFYGTSGAAESPFQGGTLCVQPPTLRTPVQTSGGSPAPPLNCSGTYALDFDAWVASGADPQLAAGAIAYGQYWFRDPATPSGSGLTDAIRFVLQP